jgi:sec-independent protein translocase protein TatA
MTPLFASLFSGPDILIVLIIALVLFGFRKLPEISRSLGKGIVEFKKGLKGMEDEPDTGTGTAAPPQQPARQEPLAIEPPRPPQRIPAPAPKFEDNAGHVTTPPQA